MDFNIGDQVIHWTFGPGEIVGVDNKSIDNRTAKYYVFRTDELTVWVPVEEQQGSLRYPASPNKFKKLFEILRSPGEALAEDRNLRKMQLAERMGERRLEAICGVIRDLHAFSLQKKLSEQDASVLERARKFLLEEWRITFAITPIEARQELDRLLNAGQRSLN
jgi:RNA polymerase-interacting CarD/CdnL/TRCF family regulator